MESLFALLIITIGSLAISRYRKKLTGLPVKVQNLLNNDILFVLIGFFTGNGFLNVIPEEAVSELTPVVYIGIGFTGFIYGTHLEWRQLKRFPLRYYGFAGFESVGTLLIVTGTLWLLTSASVFHFDRWQGTPLTPALVSGAVACGTAPSALFLLSHQYGLKSESFRLIRFSSAINDLPAILVFGIVWSIEKSYSSSGVDVVQYLPGIPEILRWVLTSIALGMVSGGLFKNMTTGIHRESVILSLLFGTIAFTSGIADLVGLSPLFVSMVAGITFANSSIRKEYIFGVLAHREHTVYTLFLVLAGTALHITPETAFWMIPVLFFTRLAAKVVFGTSGILLFARKRGENKNPLKVSTGLLPQGGVSVVMAFGFALGFDTPFSKQLFVTLIAVIFLNECVKPFSSAMLKKNA